MKSFIPILQVLPNRTWSDWRKDLMAAITVAVMLIPQGMAYAMLCGMPPIYGLYGGLVPLLVYGLMGTSRQLSIGPVAISSILLLAGIGQLAEPMSPEYIALVITSGLLIGVLHLSFGLFRLGSLVNFISQPVITGFTAAVAIIIVVSQLKDLLGIAIPRFPRLFNILEYTLWHLDEINWIAFIFFVASLLIMSILRWISRSIPGALIIVILGSFGAWLAMSKGYTLDIIGDVPSGLPAFQMPVFNLNDMLLLIPTALTVAIMGVVECTAIAKVIQSRRLNYKIHPNRELIALGLSKIVGSFFQALPTSGSFTRSAVNDDAGATSGFASIFTAILIGLTLLFFTSWFYYLPNAVLAAIIVLSVRSLFDIAEMKKLLHAHRTDFVMMLVTFVVTLVMGIEAGVLAGVFLSIAVSLFKSSRPHMVEMGRLTDTDTFRNLNRFDDIFPVAKILIVRLDNQLYFANAVYFQDTILKMAETKTDLEMVILDAGSIYDIDSAGIRVLRELYEDFKRRNIGFTITDAVGPVRDKFVRAGLVSLMGEKSFFLNNQDAVVYFQLPEEQKDEGWSPDAIQSGE